MLVFFFSGVAQADTNWNLQSVLNRAQASAAASNNEPANQNSGPFISTDNPASAMASAAVTGHAGHAEALASYALSNSNFVLDLDGSSLASGTLSQTGGGGGTGNASF